MITRDRKGKEQITLARAISKFGVASRSQAERMAADGRVTVNGRRVSSPRIWLDPREDRIAVDGQLLHAAPPAYVALHKPAGYVTTRSDELGRKTVYDLLPAGTPTVFPIGRLDKETSGLLLFTNDVRFGETLTSPGSHVLKTYRVLLDPPLTRPHAGLWRSGMTLADGTCLRPAHVNLPRVGAAETEVILEEGKNRQIRRMAGELGYTVQRLVRTAIGCVTLDGLAEGKTRPLTKDEVSGLTGRGGLPHRSRHTQGTE